MASYDSALIDGDGTGPEVVREAAKVHSGTVTQSNPSRPESRWLNPRRAFVFLAAYFLLHAVLRVVVSDSAELDESHQLLCVQEWRWGYGSDPPLYTWLQRLVFLVVGPGILGLAILKNLLLFTAFAFTYFATMEITRNARVSVFAMLSLFLFPQIAWESQRDLTHSVLAIALVPMTLLVAARLSESRSPAHYALLGLCAGFGTLSKYNYCLFAVALALAALTMPSFRSVLLNRWIFLTLTVFLLTTLPHFLWILDSLDLFWRRPEELVRRSDRRAIMGRVLGIVSVPKCAALIGGVITAVYLIVFRRIQSGPFDGGSRAARLWIGRMLLISWAIAAAIALGFGIELKNRWFNPLIVVMAIWAALFVSDRLTLTAERRFALCIGCVMLAVLLVLPGAPLAASVTQKPSRLNAPYSTLSAQLKAAVGEPTVIAAGTRLVGGNLKLFFPRSTVVSPEFETPCPTNVPWLVVWDASKSPAPPVEMVDLVKRLRGVDTTKLEPSATEALSKYAPPKKAKLAFVHLP